jgi:hypothetical protein
MAGSQQYRLRLSSQLAHQAQTMAELWDVPLTAVLRLCIEEAMEAPDRLHERLAARYGAMPDGSTLEQRRAAEQYLKSLELVNLDELLGDQHHPLPY